MEEPSLDSQLPISHWTENNVVKEKEQGVSLIHSKVAYRCINDMFHMYTYTRTHTYARTHMHIVH